ncbi:hypothetical protein KI387_008108, partial [Taxus chinensis]
CFSGRLKALGSLPLQPVSIEAPFKKWGMDFIDEISEPLHVGHKWILMPIDYFTKWVEAIPTKRGTHQIVMDFMLNHIICKFGVPVKIVADNAMSLR